MERRFSDLEFRAEGRTVAGIAMRYGDISPTHRERFEPGAFRFADTVHLDIGHDPERALAWRPGGGLELDDGDDALRLSADLPGIPAAERALAEIRAGKRSGLSVEFKAIKERREGNIRVIEEALLGGIGLVASPSYSAARVELREGRILWLP